MNENPIPSPAQFVTGALAQKRQRNPSYSLRAMARDLGVSHTYLSLVKNGRKQISAHQAQWMGEALKLDETTRAHFVKSALQTLSARSQGPRPLPKKVAAFLKLEASQARSLTDWYHFAIADLTLTKNFQFDPNWIAKRLGIPPKQAAQAMSRLERSGLLEKTDHGWRKTNSFLQLPTDKTLAPMRRLHRTMILKALAALQSSKKSDFERRDITGSMIPVNPDRLAEAKKRIARFRKQMIRFLSEGECSELYQMNVQLFALTRPTPSAVAALKEQP